MKHAIKMTVLLCALTGSYQAQSVEENDSLSVEQMVTITAGGAGSIKSGVFAAKKYEEAKVFEEKNTQRLFKHSSSPKVMSSISGQRYIEAITDGDKITIVYELDEAQNRAYHIESMERQAADKQAQALKERAKAQNATKVVTQQSGDVRVEVKIPDEDAVARHENKALKLEAEAKRLLTSATRAHGGGTVYVYELTKTIQVEAGTKALTQDFIDESSKNGTKIKSINRLSADKIKAFGSLVNKVRGGMIGVAAGLLFAGEEYISGSVAQQLERGDVPVKIDIVD